MRRCQLFVCALPILPALFISGTVAAQDKENSTAAGAKAEVVRVKTAAEVEAEKRLAERQGQAQSLLIALGADASAYADQRLRATNLMRIADLLWDSNPARSREMFRSAWDAAGLADAEDQKRLEKESQERMAKSREYFAVYPYPRLREEVLSLVVRRDVALSEEFLTKLAEQQEKESAASKAPPTFASEVVRAQRLRAAQRLLSADQTDDALRIAAPVFQKIDENSVAFLSTLREKNLALADERYAAMLTLAVVSPNSDPNTASLLASYLFSPNVYVRFFGGGGSSTGHMGNHPPPPESPALRAAYFRAASEILMRPLPQSDTTLSAINIGNKYYVVKRLLPLFEQYSTPELTAGIKAQLASLSAMVTEKQRDRNEDAVREGIQPPKPPAPDPDKSLLEQVDQAQTAAERDKLYSQLGMKAIQSGDAGARDYIAKIEDATMRKEFQTYVDSSLAMKAIEKRDTELALKMIRTGSLGHLLKVWLIARTAQSLAAKDREQAFQLLDEATIEAGRIDGSDADRPRALVAIAYATYALDRPRGWDAMNAVLRAANSAPDFTGEDGALSFGIGSQMTNNHRSSDLNITQLFQWLSHDDYERAIELAGVFQRPAARANATIAIVQTVLKSKK